MKLGLWIVSLILWIVSLLLVAHTAYAQNNLTAAPNKVLLVVSSEGRDGGKTRPGFEMDEFALAYLVLRANGLVVEVASPTGGAVEADRFNKDDDHIMAMLADDEAQKLLRATRRIQDVRLGEHQAIFVMGGKGAMFDLPKDAALQTLLARHFEQGGVVAAVCHGPAALANVKLKDGSPLVRGRRMTGFTNEEEQMFGKKWLKEFPFLLETRMRENGAQWEEAALMMPKLVVDGRLITGQNPFSTVQTAEAIVRGLGKTLVQRTIYREEASMHAVERWLNKDKEVVETIRAAPTKYKTELIAMLGYYQFKSAADDALRRQALLIMQLAEPFFEHPQLKVGMAEAEAALGDTGAARARLERLLATTPNNEEAKQLMAKLSVK
jgi:putative intracellular protease/amidase